MSIDYELGEYGRYVCEKCGMSVTGMTCGKCNKPLVHGSMTENGTEIHISQCPNGCGKIKSPRCCGQDMSCRVQLANKQEEGRASFRCSRIENLHGPGKQVLGAGRFKGYPQHSEGKPTEGSLATCREHYGFPHSLLFYIGTILILRVLLISLYGRRLVVRLI